MYLDGPQNNIFIDLFDSFNFFDTAKRQRSGFKMQRFNLDINHFLGDWTASLKINMYPYQRPVPVGEILLIKVTSDVTFLVQWTPISEFKSDFRYDGKTEKWSR